MRFNSFFLTHCARRLITPVDSALRSISQNRFYQANVPVPAGAAWTSSWTSEDEGKTSATSMRK